MAQTTQEISNTGIIHKMINNQSQALYQQQKPTCRVCFQQMTPEQILPTCKCKGSNLPIHKHCLLQWIQRSHAIRSFMGQPYFECQICRDNIFLELKNRRRLVTVRQIKQKLCNKGSCNQFLVAIVFHVLLFVIGMVYFVLFEKDIEEKVVLYMALFSIMFALSLVGVVVYKSVVREETVSIGLDEGRLWKVGVMKRLIEIVKTHIEMDE